MATTNVLLIDMPRPGVRRLTMNRPEKRNALNNELRGAILAALQEGDADADVKVSILRGAGPAWSAGYDLSANNAVDQPYYTAGGAGQWARHVVDGWFKSRRRLVQDLGPGEAGHRAGARLLFSRGQRARDEL
jgi:enoyl-CoA hydratase